MFAETLRRIRIEKGLTQEQVADALHVDASTYAYYESDKAVPNIYRTIELARVLGVTVDDLIEDLDPPKRKED